MHESREGHKGEDRPCLRGIPWCGAPDGRLRRRRWVWQRMVEGNTSWRGTPRAALGGDVESARPWSRGIPCVMAGRALRWSTARPDARPMDAAKAGRMNVSWLKSHASAVCTDEVENLKSTTTAGNTTVNLKGGLSKPGKYLLLWWHCLCVNSVCCKQHWRGTGKHFNWNIGYVKTMDLIGFCWRCAIH